MFPIHFKLTVSTVAELQRLTAFLSADNEKVVAASPKLPAETSATPAATTAKRAPSKPTAEVGTGTAAPAKTDAASSPAAVAAEAPSQASTAAPVDYPMLQKAVLQLHKMDPTAAIPIANQLGAENFKVLPQEKWADALTLVNAAIESRKAA